MPSSLLDLPSRDAPAKRPPWPDCTTRRQTPSSAPSAPCAHPGALSAKQAHPHPREDGVVPPAAAQASLRCRLCTCILGAEEDDDPSLALCGACKRRPEARRLGLGQPGASPPTAPAALAARAPSAPAREFTEAERALIRKVHGFMPAQQLLALLNERLACDLGPDATPYGMDQLHAQIGTFTAAAPAGGHGWAAQRKLIAQARRSGLLAAITEQVIDDFAVVFSLNPKQVLCLRDTLLQPEDGQ
ncbi:MULTISPECIES: hypothetical protein [Comamonadaceae]|jgi:hypothetical protein|uniref:Uncharacterized protein n=3 Tax=cellular organisms TaxID=131567 RepID=A0A1I2E2R9_9BURK|nr:MULTISPECIES: hypothetical protein [Comamonadaceae]MDR7092865.1 hypothetical protein [Hydrogenophaga laconesensis]NCU65558.1 hypothetical protein [Acidovorax sp. 210-6]GAO20883.1 hypothetical protein ALISP_0703 [Alicycliphilus sp. B1]SFE87174.1 hypothetical protein SAMN04489711_106190 [Paracidovorax wautersii]